MYELIALSLLMRGPVHGYIIAGVINDVIGPYARASNGRIYPLLTKLTDTGFVSMRHESTSAGGRVARTFELTDAGRQRFHQLMLDTSSNPREYRDLFAFKVTAFDLITSNDRIRLLTHYLEFARAHVRHLTEQGDELQANGPQYRHQPSETIRMKSVFTHLVDTWKTEQHWAEAMLHQEHH
ncbi:PadR family transcriptional regulator [Nocardia wallacei]|uniref:PadR family transcriptional regulator n=1 Tax=Nocardia wallacei TaxID=480035 RepID=UPI0024580ADF|nr:PadR family transcriptional regulator [Nocardia wallacei]